MLENLSNEMKLNIVTLIVGWSTIFLSLFLIRLFKPRLLLGEESINPA